MKPILHQAIHIQLKPSYIILGLLSIISMICSWVILVLPTAATIKFLTIILVIYSSIYFILRDALLLLPWSWQVVDVDSKGRLTLTNLHGQQFQPKLASNTMIHAKLTILNFNRDGFRLALPPVILFENSDEIRRLRVWLRWAKLENTVIK